MIDAKVLAANYAMLTRRFGVMDDANAIKLFAFLNDRLTTEQFQAAADHLWETHRYATWPAPIEFIDAAFGSLESIAALEWSQLLEAHMKNIRPDVGPKARKAWSDMGGAGAMNGPNALDRLTFLRRDFMTTRIALERAEQQKALGTGETELEALR